MTRMDEPSSSPEPPAMFRGSTLDCLLEAIRRGAKPGDTVTLTDSHGRAYDVTFGEVREREPDDTFERFYLNKWVGEGDPKSTRNPAS